MYILKCTVHRHCLWSNFNPHRYVKRNERLIVTKSPFIETHKHNHCSGVETETLLHGFGVMIMRTGGAPETEIGGIRYCWICSLWYRYEDSIPNIRCKWVTDSIPYQHTTPTPLYYICDNLQLLSHPIHPQYPTSSMRKGIITIPGWY